MTRYYCEKIYVSCMGVHHQAFDLSLYGATEINAMQHHVVKVDDPICTGDRYDSTTTEIDLFIEIAFVLLSYWLDIDFIDDSWCVFLQ